MPINELRSITIFAKVAELGSLRKAAEAQSMTPQEFAARIKAEKGLWAKVIRDAGIKPE